MVGRRRKADAGLVMALACGASPEHAAQKAGVSVRTVQRRLAEPDFRAQVDEARAEMVRRVAGMLTAAGVASVKTFTTLQESAKSESVRLGAARAVIELGCKLREAAELVGRLAALEARWETLMGEVPADGARSTEAGGATGSVPSADPP
jgi:hypothetical protein